MNNAKLIVASGLVAATAFANASLSLTQTYAPTMGGAFTGFPNTPTYNTGTGTASLTVTPAAVITTGTINKWWFTAEDTSNLGTIEFKVKIGGANPANLLHAGSKYFASLEVDNFTQTNGAAVGVGTIGKKITNYTDNGHIVNGTITPSYVGVVPHLGLASFDASTDTFTFGFTGVGVKMAEYKLNLTLQDIGPVPEPTSVAAVAFGLAGLIIRRRRSSK